MTPTIIVNIVSILVLMVILIGLLMKKENRHSSNKAFAHLIILTILYFLDNIICAVVEPNKNLVTLAFILNITAFLFLDGISLLFNEYIRRLLGRRKSKNYNLLYWIVVGTTVFRSLSTIVLSATGNLFAIENGAYVDKSLYFIPYIIALVILVEFMVIIIFNRKNFTKRQLTVILIYEFVPLVAMFIELTTNNYYCLPIGLMIAILTIYIVLNDIEQERNKIKQDMLEEWSKHDLLTGINNRRAYYADLKALGGDKVGVMFCDINGLKRCNDTFGHAMGDELIKTFVNLLVSSFEEKYCYRLSGDEFIVIIPSIEMNEFENKCKEFYGIIKQEKHIAALGWQHGLSKNINVLISESEKLMYEDKSLHGIKRDAHLQ